MKKIFLLLLLCIAIPVNSFAFDIIGWWKPKTNTFDEHDLILVTKTHFHGFTYKIVNKDGTNIYLSLNNSKKQTKVDFKDENNIIITTMRNEEKHYILITHNIDISRDEAMQLANTH